MSEHYDALSQEMSRPEIATDPAELQRLAKEQSSLVDIVTKYRAYAKISQEIHSTEELLGEASDEDMREMARHELEVLGQKRKALMEDIRSALIPKDPNDEKDVIMEIRAGTGGEEAALFAGELFRMYSRYAERHNWQAEVIDASPTELGGFKEVVFEIRGRSVYSRLKYESGVHRVQRVPSTEASGRIHTSAATVAVLPEMEEVDVDINQDELRIDIYHSGGAGGQNVNKVATAVRITHLPTGIVVTCQDERSQLKNRTKAMAVLRSRLYDAEQRKQSEQLEATRRSQVGSGDRSEKIRTYNYPQDRLTDHRIGLTVHRLPEILDGALDDVISALVANDQAERFRSSDLES
jgi:peptide chain release factor 1